MTVLPRVSAKPGDLADLAETLGTLDPLLAQISSPCPDEFIRRGEAGSACDIFYGPRFPLEKGRYLVWFWLTAGRSARSSRLLFQAIVWNGDDPRPLSRHRARLRRGAPRTVLYPLWFELAEAAQVELRAWSGANSGNFRVLGVELRRVAAAPTPPAPVRFNVFGWLWRRRRTEAFADIRPNFVELWLAFDPQRASPARCTLSTQEEPSVIIEIPQPAKTAAFTLADGRHLLSLRLPTDASGYRATLSMGARVIDLGRIEAATPRDSGSMPRLGAALAALEQPSPRWVEVVALSGARAGAAESVVTIIDRWLDFPLIPAERDAIVIVGRFFWDASGLRLHDGIARFAAGRFPALSLGCGPSGGRCVIRHQNRDVRVDLYAAEPGYLLVFPTLGEPILHSPPQPMPDAPLHPAFAHMFRRVRPSWLNCPGGDRSE